MNYLWGAICCSIIRSTNIVWMHHDLCWAVKGLLECLCAVSWWYPYRVCRPWCHQEGPYICQYIGSYPWPPGLLPCLLWGPCKRYPPWGFWWPPIPSWWCCECVPSCFCSVAESLWFLVDFCTFLPCGMFGDEGMTLLNSWQVIKSQLIGFWCMNSYSQSTQHNWVSFLPYRLNLSIWVCFEYLV